MPELSGELKGVKPLLDFRIKNILGLACILELTRQEGSEKNTFAVCLSAELCISMATQLIDQSKILMLERPSNPQ